MTLYAEFEGSKFQKKNFIDKISYPKNSDCWLWTGSTDDKGYGKINIGSGNSRKAHRVAWSWQNGKIPKNMCVLHKCDNPACVNPDHLFLGTHKDNMWDKSVKGRGAGKEPTKFYQGELDLIRKVYGLRKFSSRFVGKMFNVSRTLILDIIKYPSNDVRRLKC